MTSIINNYHFNLFLFNVRGVHNLKKHVVDSNLSYTKYKVAFMSV